VTDGPATDGAKRAGPGRPWYNHPEQKRAVHPRQHVVHGTGHLLGRSERDAGRMELAVAQSDRSLAGRAAGGKSGRMAEARGGRTLEREMPAGGACRADHEKSDEKPDARSGARIHAEQH